MAEEDWVDVPEVGGSLDSDWVDVPDDIAPDANLRNEALGIGNRFMEGIGAIADFAEATNRNINPAYPGGPQLFGFNKNQINELTRLKHEGDAETIEQVARDAQLYGDEQPQTSLGKVAGEVAFNLPGAAIPGGTVAQRLVAAGGAGLASGVARARGASEETQALAGLAGGLSPAIAQSAASKLLTSTGMRGAASEWADKYRRAALGARKSDYTKSAGRNSLVDFGEGSETSIASSFDTLVEEGMLDGSLDPVKLHDAAKAKRKTIASELRSVLSEADKVRVANGDDPVKVSFDAAERFIAKAADDEKESLRKQLAKWQDALVAEGDGSLTHLQDQKVAIWDREYAPGARSQANLDKAVGSDIRRAIETESARLIPQSKGQVSALNRRLGAFDDTQEILQRNVASSESADLLTRGLSLIRTSGGAGTALLAAVVGGGLSGLGTTGAVAAGLAELLGTAQGQRRFSRFLDALSQVGVNTRAPASAAASVPSLSALGASLSEKSGTAQGRTEARGYSSVSTNQRQQTEAGRLPETPAQPSKQSTPRPTKQEISYPDAKATPATTQSPSLFNRGTDAQLSALFSGKPLSSALFGGKKQPKMNVKEVEARIDADPYYSAVYEIESGRNPQAKNPKSSAKGGFQFIDATAKALKLDDPMDLAKSFDAVVKLDKRNADYIMDKLGIDISSDPIMRYSAHYLGAPVLGKILAAERLTEQQQAQWEYLNKTVIPRLEKLLQSKTVKA